MLIIDVLLHEMFDETKQEIVPVTFRLEMEHSLATLSKWESFFEKPFLGKDEKSIEETMWYVKAMTVTPDVPPEIYYKLSTANFESINAYIDAKMTATTFYDSTKQTPSQEIITAETIYYWMVSLNIWLECEHWHLNRLMAFIKMCNLKNAPPKKMSRSEMLSQRRALNNKRRAATGSKG